MAKAGFWLKGARGKLAGSVLQKSATAGTIIRDNVIPKNPKSAGQAVRRASFAPAAKFYSPLSVVLEQSWEGKSKAESYQEYLRQAIKDCAAGGWWVPKGTGFFPMPFQVSRGSLPAVQYTFTDSTSEHWLILNGTDDNETYGDLDLYVIGDLSKVFMNLGYSAGMQITFIFCHWREGYGHYPTYARFIIDPEDNRPFDWNALGVEAIKESDDPIHWYGTTGQDPLAAGAIIASSYENGMWRRSTQKVAVDFETMQTITSDQAYDDSVNSYRDRSLAQVDSEIYLNDSNVPMAAAVNSGATKLIAYISNADTGTSTRYVWPKKLRIETGGTVHPYIAAVIDGKFSPSAEGTDTLWIKIGDQWLINKTTKSPTRPEGVSQYVPTINGNDEATKSWLLSKGVDPSVF